MQEEIKTFINQLPEEEVYLLIRWPWVQNLMEYYWFRNECLLYQAFSDQEHIDSAYFVPVVRLQEIENDNIDLGI